jgi:microcystin-dependent protein
MSRVKTFDSTGVAPNGRLFAGDMNSIQDQYADLLNLAQAHSVGSLAVGEAGLQLLRYGPGEARISGLLRVDGILRGLGGLYAGAFTTAQRDAIAAGSRPYGLIILNTTTNQYEWNAGSDATPNWQPISPPITAGSIGTTQLADGSVTSAKIADGTIATVDIASAAVTAVKIGSDVPVIPVGAMLDWPWSSASIPAWALLPYGQLLTAASYPALQGLADAAGRPYGGNAGVNFNMPDLRGRAAVGKDDMGGTAASRITAGISGANGATLGAVFGAEGITLTTAQLPAHNHSFTTGNVSNDHTHSGTTGGRSAGHVHYDAGHAHTAYDEFAGRNRGGPFDFGASGPANWMAASSINVGYAQIGGESVDHSHNFTTGGISANHTHSGTSNNTGSGSVVQNAQPSIIVNMFMRAL